MPEDVFEKLGAELAAPEQPSAAAPAAETPAAPAAESVPAPEAAPAPEQQPAPVAQPAPAAPAPDYARVLADQNRTLTEALQRQAEQQKQVMDALLKQAQPELTPEQREAKIKEHFFTFNRDPDAFVTQRAEAAAQKVKEEIEKKLAGFAPLTPSLQVSNVVGAQIATLAQTRPELNDPAFQQVLFSKQVSDKVYADHYKGVKPEDVIRDPAFYIESYHVAKQIQAGAGSVAANNQQSQKDMDAQRQVLQGHGAPGPQGGKAPSGAQAAPDPVADMLKQMLAPSSAQDMIASAFAPKK